MHIIKLRNVLVTEIYQAWIYMELECTPPLHRKMIIISMLQNQFLNSKFKSKQAYIGDPMNVQIVCKVGLIIFQFNFSLPKIFWRQSNYTSINETYFWEARVFLRVLTHSVSKKRLCRVIWGHSAQFPLWMQWCRPRHTRLPRMPLVWSYGPSANEFRCKSKQSLFVF